MLPDVSGDEVRVRLMLVRCDERFRRRHGVAGVVPLRVRRFRRGQRQWSLTLEIRHADLGGR